MKKYLIILTSMLVTSGLSAQTWKPRVEKLGGNHTVKTLRIREGTSITVRTFAYDSLLQSKTFTGKFSSGSPDALKIKLDQVVVNRSLKNGVKQSDTYSAQNYPGMAAAAKDILSIPVEEVHYLNFNVVPFDTEFMELGFFIAIPLLILSPFACINYKDMTFNAERYGWFALGSTACIAVSIAGLTTLGRAKRLHFRESQENKGKVWKFLID